MKEHKQMQVKSYTDPKWLQEKYVDEKLNAYEIAELTGCTHTTIYKWLKRHGIKCRSNSDASKLLWEKGVYAGERHPQWRGGKWVECLNCGEPTYRSPKRLRETDRQFCSVACLQEYNQGENHHCWKEKIELTCANCGGAFAAHEHQVANGRRFCSQACFGEYHSGENHSSWRGGEWIKCDNCGKEIFKKFHRLKRSNHHFCSRDCVNEYCQGENHHLWNQAELTCQWCGETYSRCQSHARISHFCSIKCYHKWLQGPNSLTWRGGTSFDPYPPTFNKRFKRMIRRRDGYTCAVCWMPGKAVHHINYVKDDTNPQNCITLCGSCHGKTNHRRRYWKRTLTRLMVVRGCGEQDAPPAT